MDAPSLWSLLLLCSVFRLTSSDLRKFDAHRNGGKMNWIQAKEFCGNQNSYPVTINNDYDVKLIRGIMNNETFISIYLGLHKSGNRNQWSNGDQMIFNQSKVNTTNKQFCETIHKNEWKGFQCHEKMYFMCYNTSDYQLIEKKKDWCAAQRYCRNHYTDLVSINNETQNEEVIKSGANRTFWIGLMHDQWMWEDGQCSTFRNFTFMNDESKNCTSLSRFLSSAVKGTSCSNEYNIICMQGKARITVPPHPLTWEDAFDYCKEHHSGLLFINGRGDQKGLKQWLEMYKDPGPFWIGLRQSRLFGFWIWTTVDKVVDYHNWKNGSPPELPLSHHCGAVEAAPSYKWRDVNCQTKLRVLCFEDMGEETWRNNLDIYP